jgi:hypothetical protein
MEPGKAAFVSPCFIIPNPRLELLDQVREVARLRHFSLRAELGQNEVSTTMIYTHVMAKPGLGVKNPLDNI